MDSEKFAIINRSFDKQFKIALEQILDDEKFADVTLICMENEQIKAHKVILGSCSRFFNEILQRNPHPQPLIYLKGVCIENLKALVSFMYKGEATIPENKIRSFMADAEELQVEGLLYQEGKAVNQHQSVTSFLADTEGQEVCQVVKPPLKEQQNVESTNENYSPIDSCYRENNCYRSSDEHHRYMSDDLEGVQKILPPKYECIYCNFATQHKHNLKRHNETVHGLSSKPTEKYSRDHPYPLSEIRKSMSDNFEEVSHDHIDVKDFEQDQNSSLGRDMESMNCNNQIKQPFVANEREIYSNNLKGYSVLPPKFKCNICNFATYHKHNLKRHNYTVHGPSIKPQIFVERNQSVKIANTLEDQISSRTNFKCRFCSFETEQLRNVRRHERRMHTGQTRNINCNQDIGGVKLNPLFGSCTPLELNRQVDKNYHCYLCSYSTNDKSKMARHNQSQTHMKLVELDEQSRILEQYSDMVDDMNNGFKNDKIANNNNGKDENIDRCEMITNDYDQCNVDKRALKRVDLGVMDF